MPSRDYTATINNAQNWIWGEIKAPDANADGTHAFGKKQRPIFLRGDTLTLRVENEKGPHTITLESDPYSSRTPFAYPFDRHTFTYNPDVDGPLVCVGPDSDLLGTSRTWAFLITAPSGKTIDPELQVGPGGHPD